MKKYKHQKFHFKVEDIYSDDDSDGYSDDYSNDYSSHYSVDYSDHSSNHVSENFSNDPIEFISRYYLERDDSDDDSHSDLNIYSDTEDIDDSDAYLSNFIDSGVVYYSSSDHD